MRLGGFGYYAQRLIWKMVTGKEPPALIDHVDLDCANNRWGNLRAATNSENGYNRKLNVDNKSGIKGVCWEPTHNAWKAYITVNKKQYRLGRFKNLQEAGQAVADARQRLHGEFARAA